MLSFDNTDVAFEHKSDYRLKKARLLFRIFNNSALVSLGTTLTPLALKWHLPVVLPIRFTIFEQFCGGETLEKTLPTIADLQKSKVYTILDYGTEAKQTESDFDRTFTEQMKALKFGGDNASIIAISTKLTGLGSFKVFEKLHAGKTLTEEERASFERTRERLAALSEEAEKRNIQLLVDAEESWIQTPLDQLIEEMMLRHNKKEAIVFNTIQLYLNNRLPYLRQLLKRAKSSGFVAGVKLVRGAYLEKEREYALAHGVASPVHQSKELSDIDYTQALDLCIENLLHTVACVATHNESSCLYMVKRLSDLGYPNGHPNVYYSQLYGMGDHISFNLAKAGMRVAKYLPYGPVKDVIPYLMRRARENSSVNGQVNRELLLIEKEIKRRREKHSI